MLPCKSIASASEGVLGGEAILKIWRGGGALTFLSTKGLLQEIERVVLDVADNEMKETDMSKKCHRLSFPFLCVY